MGYVGRLSSAVPRNVSPKERFMISVSLKSNLRAGYTAVALLALSVACLVGCQQSSESGQPRPVTSTATEGRQFAVEGMTCEGCVETVKSALEAIPGVKSAAVSLKEKKATVVADEAQVPSSKIESAVNEAGYKARLLSATASK
jgi:copper chaperone CopZ